MIDESPVYEINFINQYTNIPKNIVDTLNSLYASEYESVRHCLALIIVNLLKFDKIAYSRWKRYYTENHTKHYTYANMMHALDIALANAYAVEIQRGYRSVGYHQDWSSSLRARPRLREFQLLEDI